MNAAWLCFEVTINLFQGWLYTTFLNKVLTARTFRNNWTQRTAKLIAILVVGGFYSLYIPFDLPITDSVVFVLTFFYSLYMFTDSFTIKLLWNGVLSLALVGLVTLTSQLFIHTIGISWDDIMSPTPIRVAFVLSSNIILMLGLYLISRFAKPDGTLPLSTLLLFLLLSGILLVALEMQFALNTRVSVPQQPVLTTIFCLLFVIVGMIVLLEMLSSSAKRRATLELEVETNRLEDAHLQEMRALYQNMRNYEHDMKHHLAALSELIDEGRAQEAAEYLRPLRKSVLPCYFSTGCAAVDALLSVKSAWMRDKGIDFQFVPYPLDELPLPAPELCSLIGNLVDNAAEATLRIPHRGSDKVYRIELRFSRTRDMFYLVCKNKTGGVPVRIKGDTYLSAKAPNRPGRGIASIRRCAEQVNGQAVFRVANDMFIAEVTLPFYRSDTE